MKFEARSIHILLVIQHKMPKKGGKLGYYETVNQALLICSKIAAILVSPDLKKIYFHVTTKPKQENWESLFGLSTPLWLLCFTLYTD